MEVWDRLSGETARAYRAFAVYRDMGVSRSVARVGQELGKSKSLMDRWSGNWHWVHRANEWDAAQDEIHRSEQEQERRDMLRRHAEIGRNILRQVNAKLIEFQTDEGVGADLSLKDIPVWTNIGTQVERKARGEPETIDGINEMQKIEARRTYEERILNDPERRERAFKLIEELAGDGLGPGGFDSGGLSPEVD